MYKEVDILDNYEVVLISGVLQEAPGGYSSVVAACGVNFDEIDDDWFPRLSVVELMISNEYPVDVIKMLDRLSHSPAFMLQESDGEVEVIVDVTSDSSLAEFVMDMDNGVAVYLKAEGAGRDGMLRHIPQHKIVSSLVRAYQKGRIQVSEELDLAKTLETALLSTTVDEAKDVQPIALAVGLLCHFADDMIPVGDI